MPEQVITIVGVSALSYNLKKMSLRDIVNKRLKELGVSRYRLAHSDLSEIIAPSTTFRFLSGECDTMTANIEDILRACGLGIIETEKKVPKWVKDLQKSA